MRFIDPFRRDVKSDRPFFPLERSGDQLLRRTVKVRNQRGDPEAAARLRRMRSNESRRRGEPATSAAQSAAPNPASWAGVNEASSKRVASGLATRAGARRFHGQTA
jgi:hypothetical protein